MEEVVSAVQRVTGIVAEISLATREQTDGIEQMNTAIMQMDQTTQQNAALVEQAAAAASAMSDQASELESLVSQFRLSGEPVARQRPALAAQPHNRRRLPSPSDT
jgi:methyl-accepting chemotaxis protein